MGLALRSDGHRVDTSDSGNEAAVVETQVPGTRVLEIEYGATLLSDPNGLRFRRQLLGRDSEWVDTGADRVATYTNLPPGRYELRVVASLDQAEVWGEASSPLRFIVAPQWWQTWRFRTGLVMSLLGSGVLAYADTGPRALALIAEHLPAIAVLDVVMPEMNGLGVARELQRRRLPTAVVFLTMFKEEDIFNEAMDVGALGYVLKENAVGDLLNCLRSVAKKEYFISPAISNLLLRRSERARGLAERTPGLTDLTPSERRILGMVSLGKTSKEIAAALYISPKTVENHRLNVAAKLGLHGNNALLKFALENRARL